MNASSSLVCAREASDTVRSLFLLGSEGIKSTKQANCHKGGFRFTFTDLNSAFTSLAYQILRYKVALLLAQTNNHIQDFIPSVVLLDRFSISPTGNPAGCTPAEPCRRPWRPVQTVSLVSCCTSMCLCCAVLTYRFINIINRRIRAVNQHLFPWEVMDDRCNACLCPFWIWLEWL